MVVVCLLQFDIVRAPVPARLSRSYEQSCRLWAYLHDSLIKGAGEKSSLTTTYWGAHQRFFKSLFVAAKVRLC